MKYLKKFNTESDVKMFVQPNVVLVADTSNVLYSVAPTNGVYIQRIDGKLYTTEQWTAAGFANDIANGVAVITDNAKFVIAKNNIDLSMEWSSDTANLVDGIDSIGSKDYAGFANTALIAVDDTSGAAYACMNHTFPNGQKGYLPALGELYICWSNKTAITEALILIGGARMDNNSDYWSSSQYNATKAYYNNLYSGVMDYSVKSSRKRVRPFTTLNLNNA